MVSDGAGQSEFMWFCRGHHNVRRLFSAIWDTPDLITSFDGFCVHRPWEHDNSWNTSDNSPFYLDQNGRSKPGKVCVQGFLNFFDSGADDGGLVLIPKSHKIFSELFEQYPTLGSDLSQFVKITDPEIWNGLLKKNGLYPVKVCCKPGDFVIWDSRTIHLGSPAKNPRPIPRVPSFSPISSPLLPSVLPGYFLLF